MKLPLYGVISITLSLVALCLSIYGIILMLLGNGPQFLLTGVAPVIALMAVVINLIFGRANP